MAETMAVVERSVGIASVQLGERSGSGGLILYIRDAMTFVVKIL